MALAETLRLTPEKPAAQADLNTPSGGQSSVWVGKQDTLLILLSLSLLSWACGAAVIEDRY
ncbi:hypothetical protein MJO29_001304 [Puccinia striiformis f. sp. tritici]|nr:hypothetical protein MJO29_001304 [Puccinia striiformis f. sp. tritici]